MEYHFRSGDGIEFRFGKCGKRLSLRHSLPEWKDIFLILFGIGMGAALHLQRIPLLHAASVVIDGGAVLLAGHSGAGKSTMTGLLTEAGCPFVCDDLAALKNKDGRVLVCPGHSWLKIPTSSAELLHVSEKNMRPVFASSPEYHERWVDTRILSGGFCQSPTPLRGLYLLTGRRAEIRKPQIFDLSPTDGCIALTQHLYGRKWLNIPQDDTLLLCARIAATVPVRRVWLPEGIESMRMSAEALLADAVTL